MVDLRYLVITLSAIFLALGIGMILGTTIIPHTKLAPLLLAKQRQMINELEHNFDDLRSEVQQTGEDLKRSQEWIQNMLPFAVQGRLKGRNICFLSKAGVFPDAMTKISAVLQWAGAAHIYPLGFGNLELFDDAVFRAGIQGQLGLAGGEKKTLLEQIGSRLGKELQGPQTSLLFFLKDKALLSLPEAPSFTCDSAIFFLSGSKKESDLVQLFLPMARTFSQNKKPIVAVEPASVEKSAMGLFRRERIDTLTGIDKPYTYLTLCLLLSGYSGHYGVRGKEALLPQP